ncbi:hypothetical protein PG985_000166 [Apiospora marii]|uniref:Uncharacterized protein n=1 Tax=Apiospora marii TaxID=335849 RepID=A0ABR1R163_9PEZI
MLTPRFLLVAFAVSTAAASKLPFIQPEDGVYAVIIGEKGQEIHTSISNMSPAGGGQIRNPGTEDRSYLVWLWLQSPLTDLKHQLDENNAVIYTNFYSIRGGTVAFSCTDSYKRLWTENLTEFFGIITTRCGWYVAGSYMKQCIDSANNPLNADCADWNLPVVGCMNCYPGQDFCKNAEGSDKSRC